MTAPARRGAATESQHSSVGEFLRDVALASIPGNSDAAALTRLGLRGGLGQNLGVASDGGFAIPPQLMPIFDAALFGSGNILSRVTRVPTTSNRAAFVAIDTTARTNGNRGGAISAEWLAEGAANVSASKVKLRAEDLSLAKLRAVGYVSNELLEDTGALETLVLPQISEELVFQAENAIVNGTGAGQPKGIVASGALVAQAIEGTQTIANTPQFLAANAAKMLAHLPVASIPRAVWLANINHYAGFVAATLGATGPAANVFSPVPDADAPFGRLLGRPIIPTEVCAAVGTVGDFILADLSMYAFASRVGHPKNGISAHVRFVYDESAFRITWRCQGQPRWRQPVTPFNGATAISPFVALAARS